MRYTRISHPSGVPERRVLWVMVALGMALVMAFSTLFVTNVSVDSAAAAVDPCGPTSTAIACENSKPGTSSNVWDINGAGDRSIQGFATDISVNVGNRIDFKVDTNAAAYTINIYRTGWYQGLGARHIATVQPSAQLPQNQPQCISDLATEFYDCGTWGVSASWNVPSNAISGVYIALLDRTDTGGQSHITFVVRDDSSRSNILFQTSDPTWHAYNSYGGSDFYQGGANGRAYKISYNRPFLTRDGTTKRDFYFSSEYAQVRFLEKNGYDVSYASGVDTDRFGSNLRNHKVFLSVGHDEYWSGAQRANIEAARDAGVNLQFLTGNEGYWRTRYEPAAGPSATPYRTLVSYKETWGNAKIDPSPEWTGTWRDPRFAPQSAGGGLPENAVTGTQYQANFSDLPVTVSAQEGKNRIWRNTSLATLAPGASAELAPHTVGYESNEDIDNGFRPDGLIRLSTTTGAVPQYLIDFGTKVVPGTTTHNLTLYRAASGALVFSAGSIQWAWGLDQKHDGVGAPPDVRMQQAQVNLLADMGAQPTNLASDLVQTAASSDTSAPVVSVNSPTQNASLTNGVSVSVTGTATDVGGRVAGVEVSTDAGDTWHAASGTATWSYSYIPTGNGAQSLRVRAIDDSGNFPASPTIRDVSVTGSMSVFGDRIPDIPDSGDTSAVELGLRFSPAVSGFVTGVRFYKSAANTGVHSGSLWNAAGARIANVSFSNETASGWQSTTFTNAVAVTAGQNYVVSYTAPKGRYSVDSWYWPYSATKSPPLTVASGFGTSPAGVFNGSGRFPNSSYQHSNYFVDVTFATDAPSTPSVSVQSSSPSAGQTGVAPSTIVTAVLDGVVEGNTPTLALSSPSGPVAGSVAWNSSTKTVSFTPAAPLAGSTQYSALITVAGAVPNGGSWTFTTATPSTYDGEFTLLGASAPVVASATDSVAVELGMSFTVSQPGAVTAIRFYKGTGNTGTHVGSLWSGAGERLTSVTFAGESATGWQTATLANPYVLTPGQRYVVSYLATKGRYSYTADYFSTVRTSGPLTADTAANGRYRYGTAGGFPTSSWRATNYFVDVVFKTGDATPNVPVSVVATSPTAGQTDVAPSVTVTAELSGESTAGAPTLELSGPAGPVVGTTAYDSTSRTVSFVPDTVLDWSTQYTATVSIGGTAVTGGIWSFTTSVTPPLSGEFNLLGNETPTVAAASDTTPTELGMSFSVSQPGSVTAIRFYKGTGNGGTHVGTLWTLSGTPLSSVTFTNETASGWQSATLAAPVELTPGDRYVVSYRAPQGRYSATSNYFATQRTSGPLTAETTNNGRYLYSSTGGFPTSTWKATSYSVDVTFVTSDRVVTPPPPPPPPPATVTSVSPTAGSTNVDPASKVTAQVANAGSAVPTLVVSGPAGGVQGTVSYVSSTGALTFTAASPFAYSTTYSAVVSISGTPLAGGSWSFTTAAQPPPPPPPPPAAVTVTSTTPSANAVDVAPTTMVSAQLSGPGAAPPTMSVTGPAGAIAGSTAFNTSTNVVTFTPAAPLAWATTFAATVSINGTALSGGTWSFKTAAEPPVVEAISLFPPDSVPANANWNDTASVQVAVRVVSSVAGTITGIRFYKGALNTGSHTGNVWNTAGNRLAQITFTNETASGWQVAMLSTPVTVQPGVELRVGLHSTTGRYSLTSNGLTNPVVNGPLSSLASGGAYTYSLNYPGTISTHNFWVDVLFKPTQS